MEPTQPDKTKIAQDITNAIDSQDDNIQLDSTNNAAPKQRPAPAPESYQPTPPADNDHKPANPYSIAETIGAPLHPPQHDETDGRRATSNNKVVLLVAVALFLSILAILLAVFGYAFFGVILFVIAIVFVVFGVFFPVGPQNEHDDNNYSQPATSEKVSATPTGRADDQSDR